jgi:valyl-tRNA synthetase
VRSELNVPLSARPPLLVIEAEPRARRILAENAEAICKMLPVSEIRFDSADAGAVPFLAEGAAFALPVAEFIDLTAETSRLAKEIAALAADIDRTAKKLANPDFVARAPEEVVEENRERLAEAQTAKARLEAALQRLRDVG